MKAINKVLYDANSKKFYANVLGSMIEIAGGDKDGSGVTIVDLLPSTGEAGKIYYNTTDGKYYIWDTTVNRYENISAITVITSITDVEPFLVDGVPLKNAFVLRPNVFYNIRYWGVTADSLKFDFDPNEGIYAGRFTARQDDINITWPVGVTTPDNVDTTIVNGHTYEFNVWQGVLILVDVTSTEEGGE